MHYNDPGPTPSSNVVWYRTDWLWKRIMWPLLVLLCSSSMASQWIPAKRPCVIKPELHWKIELHCIRQLYHLKSWLSERIKRWIEATTSFEKISSNCRKTDLRNTSALIVTPSAIRPFPSVCIWWSCIFLRSHTGIATSSIICPDLYDLGLLHIHLSLS